ncbi:hydroxymethylpyrimidine pyrophosphatase-like HAD family hydrolase [Paenibacillus sp. SORGH_AS306]|uniref:HAD family hydrolase n=1 Tax=unclassified Paenibacillus TaxID=185978 RepID=UPI00277DCBBA|nr:MULTISPECIES: HAD family hydrolase [unclassified Paenibacillus]MDQ1236029.1 hydroxymethylpyrimidine pyrophosphatase-like HAD family hydrolase [Paenibacillus sp. SORGH_AS_0306]MDR6108386.1 hydroxymethylpyrimidine pyrophosphatase-like HAD family hydrolase [Paenibacillus sp. SORGH_AS_0338]
MIYASDLDQTLIYSVRSMGMDIDLSVMQPAETYKERIISYISIATLQQLQQVAEQITFVPVTTRTLYQYARIHIFQNKVIPQYAITSNGANILVDGIVDEEWHKQILADVYTKSAPAAEALALFHTVSDPSWIVAEHFWESTFYSIVVDRELMPLDTVLALQPQLEALGWGMSVQGRKVYLVPFPVSKNRAIAEVKQRVGASKVIASGDSILDRGLLDVADYSIAPAHGELYRESIAEPALRHYSFTSTSGILAADEILQYVVATLDQEGKVSYES